MANGQIGQTGVHAASLVEHLHKAEHECVTQPHRVAELPVQDRVQNQDLALSRNTVQVCS